MFTLVVGVVGVTLGCAWIPFDRHLKAKGLDKGQREVRQVLFTLAGMVIILWSGWMSFTGRW